LDQRYKALPASLLAWFRDNARDLPWRQTKDPYAIWVSEIMLQQTRADVVKPYYQRFLKRFPNVKKLSAARLDTVLKLWEGLGYYGRARNLHSAARAIVRDFGGTFPRTKRDLLTLPGVGPYTAGAIASIAFDLNEPVVDANVARVLCRVFRIRQNPTTGEVQRRLWTLAEELLPSGAAGDFNQALMELGAIICLPRNPRCGVCPLRRFCGAKEHNEQDKIPRRAVSRQLPHHTVVTAVIYNRGRILIDQRKPNGLLGGLWEFPGGKRKGRESLETALHREIGEELGVKIHVVRRLATVHHAYSHFTVTLHAFQCQRVSGEPRCFSCTQCKWVYPKDLKNYAFPSANKKIIAALQR